MPGTDRPLLAALLVVAAVGCDKRRAEEPTARRTPPITLPGPATEGSTASGEPNPRVGSAQQLVDPELTVTADTPVIVDGEVVAHMIEATTGGKRLVMLTDAARSPSSERRFNDGTGIRVSGLVDLARAGRIPRGTTSAVSLRAASMRIPTIVVMVKTEQPDPSAGEEIPARSAPRATGVRTSEILLMLGARTQRPFLRETIRTSHGDGFGGFDIEGLAIEASGDTIRVKGRRQDHLPARRAKCMRPTAYPVEWEWNGERLTQVPRDQPVKSGC